jgi:hypothetical protein
MDTDKDVVLHFTMGGPAANVTASEGTASGVLRTRLTLSGGRGDVSINGRTVSVGAGVETQIPGGARGGDSLVEGWVREGTGEGVWRFGLDSSSSSGQSILNVLAGDPVTLTPDAIVFRVKGRLPQKVAFVVRQRDGTAPPR